MMNPHPRLYVSARHLENLKKAPTHPSLKAAQAEMETLAEKSLVNDAIEYPRNTHNEHLLRARVTQTRVLTLLARFFQTGERKYRDAAMRDLRALGAWEYWSWITWRQNNPDPLAIFDLSYGENSTTLAIAYDWLHPTLTFEEKAWFVDVARRRSIEPFLKFVDPSREKGNAWWFRSRGSNWNTVCAGGAGMLALAMYEDMPEAPEVLRRAEDSITPYMQELTKTDGAWEEGIGYWNYGMRYAFMYLLSHENATGKQHPHLLQPATRKTLKFPLDFSPNGVPCSFGDVNMFTPMPFHFAAAHRLDAPELVGDMLVRMGNGNWGGTNWPNAAEALLLVPRDKASQGGGRRAKKAAGVSEFYSGLDWGVLADKLPQPEFYLSIRGGTTEVHHGHRDLLSFHAVVKDEAMITSLGVQEYLDTTFSPRRYEIWETIPPSKNTVLINGVGVTGNSRVETTALEGPGIVGFRLDAGSCFGQQRDGPVVNACARQFVMLPEALGVLIVDAVTLPHTGRFEARMHTFAAHEIKGDGLVHLTGQRQKLTAAFASNHPAKVHTATNAPTLPGRSATMLRWCPVKLHERFVTVTLLTPGLCDAAVTLELADGHATIGVTGLEREFKVRLSVE